MAPVSGCGRAQNFIEQIHKDDSAARLASPHQHIPLYFQSAGIWRLIKPAHRHVRHHAAISYYGLKAAPSLLGNMMTLLSLLFRKGSKCGSSSFAVKLSAVASWVTVRIARHQEGLQFQRGSSHHHTGGDPSPQRYIKHQRLAPSVTTPQWRDRAVGSPGNVRIVPSNSDDITGAITNEVGAPQARIARYRKA
ncbi:MAG: hypothetical protein ACLTGI_01600 [Hoylesella buccalis]